MSTAIEELDRIIADSLDVTRHASFARWKRKWLETARGEATYKTRDPLTPESLGHAQAEARASVAAHVARIGAALETGQTRSMFDQGPQRVAASCVFVRAEPRNV